MKERIYAVTIEFYDHQSDARWQDKAELCSFGATVVYQIGWLVGEDKLVYKVAGQVDRNNGDVGDTIAILKSTVIKFKRLNIRL